MNLDPLLSVKKLKKVLHSTGDLCDVIFGWDVEDNLYDDLSTGVCEMCGGGPVISMMKACRNLGADKSKVILYRNSGDVTDERSQVVGYLAAMVYR